MFPSVGRNDRCKHNHIPSRHWRSHRRALLPHQIPHQAQRGGIAMPAQSEKVKKLLLDIRLRKAKCKDCARLATKRIGGTPLCRKHYSERILKPLLQKIKQGKVKCQCPGCSKIARQNIGNYACCHAHYVESNTLLNSVFSVKGA